MSTSNLDWTTIDSAQGTVGIPELLKQIEEMQDWTLKGKPGSFTEYDAWGYLQAAIYDEGNVRAAAYAVVPELSRMCRNRRTVREKMRALSLITLVTVGGLEGVDDIPQELFGRFESAIVGLSDLGEEGVSSKDLRLFTRYMASSVLILSTRDVLAARLVDLLFQDAIEFRCDSCSSILEFKWNGSNWTEGGGALAPHPKPRASRLGRLVELAERFEFEEPYKRIADFDAIVRCANCEGQVRILELLRKSVLACCPLARWPGWEPSI